jgi:hypothetical protein
MKQRLTHASTAVVGAVAILLLGMIDTGGGQAAASSVQIRPIEDFLDAQGSSPDFPESFNYAAWIDPQTQRFASVDYAGLANKWIEKESDLAMSLGTETEGKIIERLLPDGRAEVTVLLHTKNALTWVAQFVPVGLPWGDALFGHFAEDVLAGKDPALGDSFLKAVFINDAPGDPMPDLLLEFTAPEPTREWIRCSIEVNADGTLREAFGVPDGTPGHAQMTQIGLYKTAGKGGAADGYPAEHIKLKVVGR